MSFDDGSLGRREDRTDPRGRGRTGFGGLLAGIYDRVQTHLRTWPARYIDMRTSRYEHD